MWSNDSLQNLICDKMKDYLLIVVSNRQPYVHAWDKGKIKTTRGAGGVITALDPIMKACKGTWVAYGAGSADRRVTDKNGKIQVPMDDPQYTLKRVWLTKEEGQGYYYGYSNEAIWPLCHMVYKRPIFKEDDWEYYKQVNKKFASAVIEEVGDRNAFIWIQDYHLCLLPKYLKEMAKSQLIVSHFWHIPWPNYETFRICPQRKEILEGLLANDLLGFHIRYFCDNFLYTVDRELECKIDRERLSITRGGQECMIRPYAISIDFEGITKLSNSKNVAKYERGLKREYDLSGKKVLLGLDRIDYTKGIPERLLALDKLLEKHPELKEKIVFVQMGEPSRILIPQYKALNDEINGLVQQINWKHSTDDWKPIIFIRQHMSFEEVLAFYRVGDICVVSSLHDGMNLVAKEFVASRTDEDGVLVISQFTGASRELTDAIMINPFNADQFADSLYEAIILPTDEAKKRMARMRSHIQMNNIFRWAGRVVSDLLRFDFSEDF